MAEIVDDVPAVALAVYAHPDDPDVAAGGTLARWAAAGSTVHVCICADGDKGSEDPSVRARDLVAIRRGETAAAGQILGVAEHHWLGLPDGEVEDGPELRQRIVSLVRGSSRTRWWRRTRPQCSSASTTSTTGITWSRDGPLSTALSPAAGNPHYFPAAGPVDKVEVLYLSGTLEPDVWVDISTTIDTKAAAVACHTSQISESGEWLRGVVRQRAEEAGREVGVRFAEGFRRIQLV